MVDLYDIDSNISYEQIQTTLDRAIKTKDPKIFKEVLEMLNYYYEEFEKSSVLCVILEETSKKKIVKKVFKVATTLWEAEFATDVFTSIIFATKSKKIIKKVLKEVAKIDDEYFVVQFLKITVKRIYSLENKALNAQMIQIINNLYSKKDKKELLALIQH